MNKNINAQSDINTFLKTLELKDENNNINYKTNNNTNTNSMMDPLRWSYKNNVIKSDQKKGDNPFLERNIDLNKIGISHNMPAYQNMGDSRNSMVNTRLSPQDLSMSKSNLESTRNSMINHSNHVKFIDYNQFSENFRNSKHISDEDYSTNIDKNINNYYKNDDINKKMDERDMVPTISNLSL